MRITSQEKSYLECLSSLLAGQGSDEAKFIFFKHKLAGKKIQFNTQEGLYQVLEGAKGHALLAHHVEGYLEGDLLAVQTHGPSSQRVTYVGEFELKQGETYDYCGNTYVVLANKGPRAKGTSKLFLGVKKNLLEHLAKLYY